MSGKCDIKSAVVGGMLVAIAAICIGAAKVEPTVGRYQVSAGPGHLLVVDTVTGQVWRSFVGSGQSGSSDTNFFAPKMDFAK